MLIINLFNYFKISVKFHSFSTFPIFVVLKVRLSLKDESSCVINIVRQEVEIIFFLILITHHINVLHKYLQFLLEQTLH